MPASIQEIYYLHMDFYFVQLFLILLLGGFISILTFPPAKKNRVFLVVTFLYLYLLEGFRSLDFGNDPWYQDLYRATDLISWKNILHWDRYLNFKSETGYVVLNKCLNFISNNVQLLYIFISAVYLHSMYKYLKRYSIVPVLSVFVFYVVFWFQSFYVLRQYLAIAMCLYALPFVFQRNLKGFAIVMAFAFTIHQSCIVFVPVYFLYNYRIKMNVKYTIIFLVACVALLVTMKALMQFSLGFLVGYDSYLDEELESDGNFKMALVYIFFFACYSVFAYKEKESLEENLFFKMLGIAIMLQIAGTSFVLMQRLNLYYAISLLIVIPNTIKMMRDGWMKFGFASFTMLLYLYIMYLDFVKDRYQIVPYSNILF